MAKAEHFCPRDKELLASNDVSGYRYYSCEHCHGFWLPGSSLNRILSSEGFRSLENLPLANDPAVSCPGCRRTCRAVTIQGCTLDLCEQCRGLWLDAGEVERLKSLFPADSAVVDAAVIKPGNSDVWTAAQAVDFVVQLLFLAAR
jgi:Zn-finger nucleic acid-binding protein